MSHAAIKMAIFLLITGTLAGISISSLLRAQGDPKPAGVSAAIFSAAFLYFSWACYRGICNQRKARVLYYFERKLGQSETWLAGEAYLQHSRQLDEIASRNNFRPLSAFASGDDLVRGEMLQWFCTNEAMDTIERHLQDDAVSTLPATVISDLKKMRDALFLASSKSVKFCFFLRAGTSANVLEMERRKGTFF